MVEIDIIKDHLYKDTERNIMSDLFKRKVKVEPQRLSRYSFDLKRFRDERVLRGESSKNYDSHFNIYQGQKDMERKYSKDITGIPIDELNEVVRTGCTRYSKEYTTVYDFTDSLDFILANIFMGNRIKIRRGIEENANCYGLTYKDVSRALLGYNKYLMKDIHLDVFLEVDDNMDKFFCTLYENVNRNSAIDYFGEKIDLTGYNLKEEEKIVTVFSVLVLRYMNEMMSHLLVKKYQPLKAEYGSKLNIVSKGISNIIIYGDEYLTEEHDVKFKSVIGDMVLRCLTTEVCKQYERIGEDYCYYVVD